MNLLCLPSQCYKSVKPHILCLILIYALQVSPAHVFTPLSLGLWAPGVAYDKSTDTDTSYLLALSQVLKLHKAGLKCFP